MQKSQKIHNHGLAMHVSCTDLMVFDMEKFQIVIVGYICPGRFDCFMMWEPFYISQIINEMMQKSQRGLEIHVAGINLIGFFYVGTILHITKYKRNAAEICDYLSWAGDAYVLDRFDCFLMWGPFYISQIINQMLQILILEERL